MRGAARGRGTTKALRSHGQVWVTTSTGTWDPSERSCDCQMGTGHSLPERSNPSSGCGWKAVPSEVRARVRTWNYVGPNGMGTFWRKKGAAFAAPRFYGVPDAI
jgi:hypothetical protein